MRMASSGETHKLVEIESKDWKELRDLFLVDWPQHILGYSIVNNYIEWTEKSEGHQIANLKVFSVDGDWRRDGTFIVIVSSRFIVIVLFKYTFQSPGDHSISPRRTGISCSYTASQRTRSVLV